MENEKNTSLIDIDKENKLQNSTTEIVNKIVESSNTDEIKDLTNLFSINQAKKNMIRVVKLNDLLDKINDQAIDRFTNNPDEISNKELLDYMNAVQTNIEKAQKMINSVDTSPIIQINQQNNEISIGEESYVKLSKESQEKVLKIVQEILKLQDNKKQEIKVDLEGKGDIYD